MADGFFNRRDFLGIPGGFTGALLGSRLVGRAAIRTAER